jgi:hypothetical protein
MQRVMSLILTMILFPGTYAFAQATRTWVSGVGDDANPCSRTAPCKTWAGAISKTAAGGEIDALDPGGYGAVTITKAITLDATGTFGSTLASGGVNGIVVNAGANDVVVIRGLSINGAGTTLGLNGIRFLAGAALHVEDTVISRFSNSGIDFEPAGAAQLFVSNTIIRDTGSTAILVKPGISGSAKASLDGVRLNKNGGGVRAEANSIVIVRNSVAAGNLFNGFQAISGGGSAQINLESCVSANNGTNGARADGISAMIRLTNVTVTNNGGAGLSTVNGGIIESFGNNRLRGNTGGDGAPNVVITQQ